MARWAQSVRSRDQIVLFSPTLQDTIPADHPVRLFDEVLSELDFSDWERRYFLKDGQPPIHPRVMASVILYGLSLGIRSSRRLEGACGNRVDFIWLAEGRVIDHSTPAIFRTRFDKELKALFRQVGRVAIGMGMANLNQVALDGTVKRANNSGYAVAKKASLEQKLAALDQQVAELLIQAEAADKADNALFGESSPSQLPKELKDLKARQQKLARALKKVKEIDAKQAAMGRRSEKGPAVPTTDPDAMILKNKTDGYAPNYLVIFATESQSGLIMDYQVPGDGDEPSTVMPAIENLKAAYGNKPAEPVESQPAEPVESQPAEPVESQPAEPVESQPAESPVIGSQPVEASEMQPIEPIEKRSIEAQAIELKPAPDPAVVVDLLADTNFNTGPNLRRLLDAGVMPWMPAKAAGVIPDAQTMVAPAGPAEASAGPAETPFPSRNDASIAMPLLPINPQTKTIDRSAFTYDRAANAYTCPLGRSLPLLHFKTDQTAAGPVKYALYRCRDCSGCGLKHKCVSGKKNTNRMLRRDEHEDLREQLTARMASNQGKEKYKRRSHQAETPFAVLNTTMNVRQLLLRGLERVRTEIGWIATAYNLKKMTTLLAARKKEAMAN